MTDTREDEVTLNRAKHGDRTARRKSATAPAPPRIPRITRLMALAIKFQEMIDRGEVRDYAELARLGFVTRARVTQIMNLLNLSPDIQEQILSWSQPGCSAPCIHERSLRRLTGLLDWRTQRVQWTKSLSAPIGLAAPLLPHSKELILKGLRPLPEERYDADGE